MIRLHSSPLRLVGFYLLFLAAIVSQPWRLLAQAPAPAAGVKFATVSEADMKTFLTYLASDELLGRDAYSEGYGLAAAYVADHLRQWGLKPLGDNGTYFQAVKNRGYRVTRNSAITVTANGQTRTFKHGDHVTFPINSGGWQSLKFDGVEFVGYGLVMLPSPATNNIGHDDFRGRNVKGQLVAWLPGAPSALAQGGGRGGRGGGGGNRANYAIQTAGAAAVLSFSPSVPPPSAAEEALAKAQDALNQATQAVTDAQAQLRAAARGGRGGGRAGGARGGRGAAPVAADLTTVLKVDNVVPPQITADEVFYEFLLGAETFAKLRAAAESGAPLSPTRVPAQISIDIDNSYEVVSTQISKNVVGMVEGSDPKLRDTYVLFGSHLDHTGYRTSVQTGGRGGRGAPTPGVGEPDLINNGADDDGSGSTALMGIAKAFATGPKPRRSVVFVWHTGEEDGLLGSRYMADFPVVPLDRVQAQFNIDMIGRNRDDDPQLGNTVFVIGADRISTDLHNLVVDTNQSTAKPLTLDYEYNDPADPNSFYTRSDHYSYAAKGIPIAFFFTGTHVDYHQPTDHADKILYPKLTRIAQLVYQAGFNVAHSERTLTRDNRGPRSGRGFSGRIDK